jgi:hypothetical protein
MAVPRRRTSSCPSFPSPEDAVFRYPRRIAPAASLALVLALAAPAGAQPAPRASADPLLGRIRPEWISAHVRFLSDRLLEGRETAARGGELAARYVAAELERLGLAPLGRDSSFLAPVPLRYSSVVPDRTSLTLITPAGAGRLEPGRDYLVHADKQREEVELKGSVVFVGWGVTAPEHGYDDYRGVDVRGKFAAMLFGGPAALPPDERGHYASLAAKERNALAHGALGVVTLWPTPGEVLGEKLGQLEGFGWLDPDGTPHSPFFELGPAIRLSETGSAKLLGAARRSFAEVAQALAQGPLSFPIDATLALSAAFTQRLTSSSNAGAVLQGSDPALRREYVVYSAHLDHVGVRAPVDGDSVYHGAIDNAGGTAVLLALARAHVQLPRPKRSVIFLAVTGEEKGILGSDYFVHHPPVPLEAIVANVNLDNFVMISPVRDFAPYGAKYSTLDGEVKRAFARLGVDWSDDPLPWMTIFTRSDHYPFMRQGVPAVMLFPGKASGRGPQDGVATQRRWFETVHHTPRDRFDQGIDWGAGVTYAEANLLIGYAAADRSERPAWRGRFFFHRPGRGPRGSSGTQE